MKLSTILVPLCTYLSPAPYPLNLDALALSSCLHDGTLSAIDLMEATLDRIEAVNPKLGAIIAMKDRHTLLQLALQADQSERKGWLHGIPIAIKDLSNVKGFPTSNGGSPLSSSGNPATESDPFVQRLMDAGAIVIGKTNSPESGLGSHTYNTRWGVTRNPYNPSLSAGGSSGGAAVAVATHMLAIADGSDMMGSLRNPAGWNHIYSFRPTAGLMEYDDQCPVNPLDYPISTVGPIARCVQDLAAYLTTLVGSDTPYDSCYDPVQRPYRVAWLGDWDGAYPMEAGILETCRRALEEADESGSITVQDISKSIFPAQDLWKSWTIIRSAIVSYTELSKHGREALLGESSKVREELQWEVGRGLQIGTAELDEAKRVANNLSCVCESILQEYDVLALPSAQVWPFPVSWSHPKRIGDTDMDTYHRWMEVVVPASLAGLPVATVPAGFSDLGLPMGIQLIGRRHCDEKLLKIARRVQDCQDKSL